MDLDSRINSLLKEKAFRKKKKEELNQLKDYSRDLQEEYDTFYGKEIKLQKCLDKISDKDENLHYDPIEVQHQISSIRNQLNRIRELKTYYSNKRKKVDNLIDDLEKVMMWK